jgi:hypothetical protein
MPRPAAGIHRDYRYDGGMKEPVHVPHQVLTAASHELRGPLGVARGYLRLLETQVNDEPQAQKSIKLACRATDQMAALLDEISRYARLARGEARLSPEVTPLSNILAAAIPKIVLPTEPHVEVASEVPPEVKVWADVAVTGEFCAAMGTALARAAVHGGTRVFSAPAPSDNPDVEVALRPAEAAEMTAEVRPPRLDRSGMGLALALAELSLRLQEGSLSELWVDGRWGGYVLRFKAAPQP